MTVLVIEDDEIILEGLKIALQQEGYEVKSATTQGDAMVLVANGVPFDFCLLDVMLPDGDGYNICREIRRHSEVPILFLTACDDEIHTVLALEQGADDYISKPFRIRELLARMKAILRRTGKIGKENVVQMVGDKQVDLQTRKINGKDGEIVLTSMEYKLLLIFLKNRGQILSRQQILNQIWDEAGDFVNDNTLSVYIKRLRKKLGEDSEVEVIQTIRGVGYRLG